jgi:hypothetical protein
MTAPPSQGEPMPGLAPHRRMLRLALGTTLSFVTAELLDWDLSFLVTVFLVQFLAASGPALGLRQGSAVVLALGLATSAAATVSTLLVDMPALLAIVLGVALFLAFVLQRSGRSPALGTLILVAFGFLPVVAIQEPDLVPMLTYYLIRSAAVAVLWVWLLHVLLPEPGPAASPVKPAGDGSADVIRTALVDTTVLLPVLLTAMTLEVSAALVIVLTVTAILAQHRKAGGRRVARGLLLANLLGGSTALVAYELLSAVPTLGFLTALLLLVSLLYARAIADNAMRAPVLTTALVTFVIVFGMGVAPFLEEPGATLTLRLRNLALACLYTYAALSLLGRTGRPTDGK